MDPATIATIVGWFVQPAISALFNGTQQYLLQRLGVSPSRSSTPDIKPLLDEYLQRLTERLDEDRIARLYGAFSKLKDAPKSSAMRELLIEALDGFHQVAQIPQQGTTRGRPNAELCCMAFVGMAASYNLLHDQPELIAEKMVEAIHADADTARLWLGEDLVSEIILRFPSLAPGITCPKCGFRNPPGASFCNQDGYPLNLGHKLPLQLSSQTSSLHLIRQPDVKWITILPGSLLPQVTDFFSLHIILDDEEVGAIRQGEHSTLEVQPGNHIIFLRLAVIVGDYLSPRLAFDIAHGEKVTFLCQVIFPAFRGKVKVQLWKQ